jgi:hypothetical protein
LVKFGFVCANSGSRLRPAGLTVSTARRSICPRAPIPRRRPGRRAGTRYAAAHREGRARVLACLEPGRAPRLFSLLMQAGNRAAWADESAAALVGPHR